MEKPEVEGIEEQKEEESTEVASIEQQYDFTTLKEQVRKERNFSKKATDGKKDVWRMRLKLYNNQKKDAEAIGDPLLFTVMQTLLASLYEDELSAGFNGVSDGDGEIAKNVEQMAESDRTQMELDEIEYDWDFDACFFGRGFVLQQDFDRDEMIPVPENIDPLALHRDPYAKSVNGKGKRRKGAARFLGIERFVTEEDVEEDAGFFNQDKLGLVAEEDFIQLEKDRQARAEASGRDFEKSQQDLGDNTEYPVYQWFTHWAPVTVEGDKKIRGKVQKVEVWLTGDLKNIIKFKPLKSYKGKDCHDWPIQDRPLYPTAHDWDGVSVPDLCEDKQRARAALLNLTMQGLKADLFPMYLFNKTKITNRNELNFGFNKFVGVDGDINNTVMPMNKANPRMDILNFFLDTLDQSAQRSTATPEVQQGMVSNQQRTLGELNLVAAKVDTRYTLAMKVWGWSAKRFWARWWEQYMENMAEEIDEKMVRISGTLGVSSRTFSRKDLEPKGDLDIVIESKVVSESKRAMKLQNFMEFSAAYAESGVLNQKYQARKHAELAGFAKDEIDFMLPPSVDDLVAEGENAELSKDKPVAISQIDDHQAHIAVHARAKQTKALIAHIMAHKKAMTLPRDQDIASGGKTMPELQAAQQAGGMPGMPPVQAPGGVGSVPMPPTASEMASGGGAGSTAGGNQAIIPGM